MKSITSIKIPIFNKTRITVTIYVVMKLYNCQIPCGRKHFWKKNINNTNKNK